MTLVGVTVLSAFAVFADPGDSSDPIVTKSYVDAQIESVKAESGSYYRVVHVSEGQRIIGTEGTEIIVRSGEAIIIADGINGVADITAGLDLANGDRVGKDHLLLIPRDDGRGVKALTEAYMMIRGEYTLKN